MNLLARHAAASVVAFGRQTHTAAELVALAAAVAELLPSSPGSEEIVVVCRDRFRFAVALLAAWQRGYAVALPPSSQIEAIAAVRHRPGVRTVLHDVDGIDRGIDVRAARPRLGVPFAPTELAPERHLATVYTSGSTGSQLACPKTAAQLIGEAETLCKAFELAGVRVVPMVPAHHIYGLLFGVLVPLVGGGSFLCETPLHAVELVAVTEPGDVLVAVPAHLRALLGADALPPVHRVFSSGAPLPPSTAEQLQLRFGWTVTEVFGSTETGGIGWRQSGGRGAYHPIPGVSVGEGASQALLLDSPFLHPEAPRPYACADRVQLRGDGTFLHLGRADGVLKVGGVRVSLLEIEERLLGIEGVRDAAAMAVEVEGPRGIEIWAAVVAPGLGLPGIREALLQWLLPVALPRRIRLVRELPREPSGKLVRSALASLFAREPRS